MLKRKKTINFKKKIREIQGESQQWLNALANEGVDYMTSETQRGIDKDGRQFKAYKPSTIKRKKSSIVNLTDTGKMLKGITSKYSNRGDNYVLKFFLQGSRKKGLSNNDIAYYNKLKGREFLGFPKEKESKFKKELIAMLRKILS